MELNSTPVVSYEYDSASRLIQRVEGGTTTNYTWDVWDLIKEVKSGTVNETTNYLVPNGEVLAFERGGDWFYLQGDSLNSTQLVTDENGAQVGRFIYGAWGEELYANELVPGILESRFVGGLGCRKDTATGLIYMRHRWYDCQLQRFISRDPKAYSEHVSSRSTSKQDKNPLSDFQWLGDDENLYRYVGNVPVDRVDEFGLGPRKKKPYKQRPPLFWTGPAPVKILGKWIPKGTCEILKDACETHRLSILIDPITYSVIPEGCKDQHAKAKCKWLYDECMANRWHTGYYQLFWDMEPLVPPAGF